MREYGEHVLDGCVHIALRRRPFKWSETVAKNDWSIPRSTIEQRHGVFIWWPTIPVVSSAARARDKRVIDEARYEREIQEACIKFILFRPRYSLCSQSQNAQIVRRDEGMRVIMIRDVPA